METINIHTTNKNTQDILDKLVVSAIYTLDYIYDWDCSSTSALSLSFSGADLREALLAFSLSQTEECCEAHLQKSLLQTIEIYGRLADKRSLSNKYPHQKVAFVKSAMNDCKISKQAMLQGFAAYIALNLNEMDDQIAGYDYLCELTGNPSNLSNKDRHTLDVWDNDVSSEVRADYATSNIEPFQLSTTQNKEQNDANRK